MFHLQVARAKMKRHCDAVLAALAVALAAGEVWAQTTPACSGLLTRSESSLALQAGMLGG